MNDHFNAEEDMSNNAFTSGQNGSNNDNNNNSNSIDKSNPENGRY